MLKLPVLTGNRSACFSPDGKWVVTTGDDTARIWEAASGRLLATLQRHTDYVYSASFSPDSRWVITASRDGTARVYPWELFAPVEEIVNVAGKRVLRELTTEERAKYLHESQNQ